jgi:hypothetical protein
VAGTFLTLADPPGSFRTGQKLVEETRPVSCPGGFSRGRGPVTQAAFSSCRFGDQRSYRGGLLAKIKTGAVQ